MDIMLQISYADFCFGACILKENYGGGFLDWHRKGITRELTLYDNRTCKDIADIVYASSKKKAKGILCGISLSLYQRGNEVLIKFGGQNAVMCKLDESDFIITNNSKSLKLAADTERLQYFVRYTRGNQTYRANISRNQTPVDFFRIILGLLSLGLCIPRRRTILMPECRELSYEEQELLFLASIVMQLIYFPKDYNDWS